MKPAKYTISDASFIGHYFKLLVFHLHRFKTAKHVILISVVVICIVARYVASLDDKIQMPNKQEAVTDKYPKLPLRINKLILAPKGSFSSKNNFFKLRQVRFNKEKTNLRYLTLSDVQ